MQRAPELDLSMKNQSPNPITPYHQAAISLKKSFTSSTTFVRRGLTPSKTNLFLAFHNTQQIIEGSPMKIMEISSFSFLTLFHQDLRKELNIIIKGKTILNELPHHNRDLLRIARGAMTEQR